MKIYDNILIAGDLNSEMTESAMEFVKPIICITQSKIPHVLKIPINHCVQIYKLSQVLIKISV